MCEQLERIRRRVEAAAERAGRRGTEITVVAVSKKKPASMIRSLYECGHRVFGENYVQEGVEKAEDLSDLPALQWHFIGHLQRNKAKLAVRWFDWIETIDSVRLARAVDRRAGELGRRINILLQVNIAKESSKHGVHPEELPGLIEEVCQLPNLDVRGLMTIHPFCQEAEAARVWFRRLSELRDQVRDSFPNVDLEHLSMGMSRDFEVAIEEGATIVRIGTALFGPRT